MRFLASAVLAVVVSTAPSVRADGPPVHLLSTAPSTELKVSTDRRDVTYETLIESSAGKTTTSGVKVYLTPFAGPKRVTLDCFIDDKPCKNPFDVPPLQSVTLKITGTLDTPGTYSGIVSIVAGTSRQSAKISITRTLPPALPVKVLSFAKVEGKSDLRIRFNLQETAGLAHAMTPPSLIALDLQRTPKGKAQASFKTAKALDANEHEIKTNWTLPAGGPTAVSIDIDGIESPGEYSGTVRFGTPEAQYVDQPVSIVVRRSGLLAGFLIALGVLISYLLHTLLKLKPWFVQEKQAVGLAQDLKEIVSDLKPNDDENRVVAVISGNLGALMQKIDDGIAVDSAKLDETDRKLTLLRKWIVAERRVKALPPALAGKVRKAVDDAQTALLKDGLSAGDAATASGALDALEPAIAAAIKEELKQRITDMQAAVKTAGFTAAAATAQVGAQVTPALARAMTAVNGGRVDESRAEFGTAQTAYAKSLAIDLKSRLAQPEPAGFDSAAWARLSADMQPLLAKAAAATGDAAIDAARAALGQFVATAGTKLETLSTKLGKMIESNAAIPQQDKKDLGARAATLNTDVNGIAAQVASGSVEAAAAAYAKAVSDFDQLKKDAAKFGTTLGGAEAAAPAAAPAVPSALDSLPLDVATVLIPRASRVHTEPGFWKALVASADAIVFVVALAIAVILGVKLLWIDNYTWGSFSDCLIAVLWGLGLHQVSGNAFEGIPALAQKFG